MDNVLTESIDVAQIVLYAFWAFFAGLIFWIRREDRREGYPLESDNPRRVGGTGAILLPRPKTFFLPLGGSVRVPSFVRDPRPISATRSAASSGSPLEPVGNPLLACVGPASYAQRADEPETTREGHDLIVPMRAEPAYSVSAGPDPRGWPVVDNKGAVAGTVKDIWLDRADVMVRYLEIELPRGGETADAEEREYQSYRASPSDTQNDESSRLLPMTMMRLLTEKRVVKVASVHAHQFGDVPTLRDPLRVTTLEEEKICAYYAGARLYGDPKRLGPVV